MALTKGQGQGQGEDRYWIWEWEQTGRVGGDGHYHTPANTLGSMGRGSTRSSLSGSTTGDPGIQGPHKREALRGRDKGGGAKTGVKGGLQRGRTRGRGR